jgi:flavin reductase (DIM6/NTAB) family NADH-FMN oxidoreductase RutF
MKKDSAPDENWRTVFPSFPVVMATVESNGSKNIITLGMVHVFSFDPPIVGIGVSPRRHSFQMLKDSGEFVINIPTKELVPQTLFCGIKSGNKIDKFKETGLTPVPGEAVKAPLIGECPVNLECKVVKETEVGDHVWFLGEVVKAHIKENYRRGDAVSYWAGEFRMMGELVGKRQ